MGEFFKFFRKFLIKAGAQHNGGAAPLFLLLGLEFERFFSALESLGLFLVQYLGNGCNLVDVALLTYSQYFFDTERRAFRFYRKKTRLRSKNSSEVIIPIIEPLRRIVEEIGAPPKLNAPVFPSDIKWRD